MNSTVHLIIIAYFTNGRLSDVVVSHLGLPKPGGCKTLISVIRKGLDTRLLACVGREVVL